MKSKMGKPKRMYFLEKDATDEQIHAFIDALMADAKQEEAQKNCLSESADGESVEKRDSRGAGGRRTRLKRHAP